MIIKISIIFFSLLSTVFISSAQKRVVCGYSSWAVYRSDLGALNPSEIDPSPCTHLVYAYLGVTEFGEIDILDQTSEIEKEGLKNFAELKNRSDTADLKVLISIGGQRLGKGVLDGVVWNTDMRNAFIESCNKFFDRWHFDGLDIAWQYPSKNDKEKFVEVLKELRANFTERFVLSVTAPHDPTDGYDIIEIAKYVDFINLLTFDYHTPGNNENITEINAPLYSVNDGPNIDESLAKWLNLGLASEMINLGLATYGHSYSLENSDQNGIGAPASIGISGAYTLTPGFLAYYEICYDYDDWKVNATEYKEPYKYSDFNWISYDDEASITEKVDYAINQNLGGVFVWSLDTDDFLGNCLGYGLIDVIAEKLNNRISHMEMEHAKRNRVANRRRVKLN